MFNTNFKTLLTNELLTTISSVYPEYCSYYEQCSPLELATGSNIQSLINNGDLDAYLLSNLFKKVENLDLGVDPFEAAYSNFRKVIALGNASEKDVSALFNVMTDEPIAKILHIARDHCHKAFKSFNKSSLVPRFTLGATIQVNKNEPVTSRIKDMTGLDLSDALYNSSVLTRLPRLNKIAAASGYVEAQAVHKNSLIARIIGKQDTGLIVQQNGVGDYIADVLRYYANIDMSIAPELHRELACLASLGDDFATADKSNASDLLLRVLIKFLYPTEMYDYLVSITPTKVKIGDDILPVSMMCPAGNGYLMPLQTFTYWVLATACCDYKNITKPVYVYGDDVILSKDAFIPYTKLVGALGLVVNLDKSYHTGPFYESCGGDFLFGSNVRPFYVKRIPESRSDIHALHSIINGVRRVGYYNNDRIWISDRFATLWLRLQQLIPIKDRLYGPRHFGEACINTEDETLYCIKSGHKVNSSGLPYASEKIRIFTEKLSYDPKRTICDEIKGIPGRFTIQALMEPSVKGLGQVWSEKTKSFYFPARFRPVSKGYSPQWVPYTIFGQAPECVDELFCLIKDNSNVFVSSDSRFTARLQKSKQINAVRDLIDVLKAISLGKELIVDRVTADVLTLEF